MKKRIKPHCTLAALFCIGALVFTSVLCHFPSRAASVEKPHLSAKAAFLYEANSKSVLYEKNADARMGPASTTKIVTAILTLESADPGAIVEITREMTGIEGSSLYLKEGERLSVRDLLYGLMLRSANDAAIALAIHACGTVEAFVGKMNAFAERLGLVNTHFANPNGLDAPDHYTTARELALIAAYASKNEAFNEIVSTKKIIIAKGTESARLVVNHNKLLNAYEGCVGTKTGFTKKCGRTLVSAYAEGGIYLIGVTLNAPDDWNDHKKLYDYARASYQMTEALQPFEYTKRVGVLGGVVDELEITNNKGSYHFEPQTNTLPTLTVELPRILVAPVNEGDRLGQIRIRYSDGYEETVALVASSSVPKRKTGLF